LVKKNTAGNNLLLFEIPTKPILLLKKILNSKNLSSQKGRKGEKIQKSTYVKLLNLIRSFLTLEYKILIEKN